MTILTRLKNYASLDHHNAECVALGSVVPFYDGSYWLNGKRAENFGYEAGLRLGGNRLTLYRPPRVRRGRFDQRKREAIGGFSASSGKRMARFLRETKAQYKTMGTLTYPSAQGYGYDGRKAKNDLRVLLQKLKRHYSWNPEFSIFWFAEIQEKNTKAIHFHFFCTNYIDEAWLSRMWFDIVNSNNEFHLMFGARMRSIVSGKFGMVSYAQKYAKKQKQKEIPGCVSNFGRFWGIVGYKEVSAATIRLSNLMQMSHNWHEKLVNIDLIYKKALEKGVLNEFEVKSRQDDGSGVIVERDIGCVVYEMRCPVLIGKVTKLINEMIFDYKAKVKSRGWVCQSSVNTFRSGKRKGSSPHVMQSG
jgi:hypothetical protein